MKTKYLIIINLVTFSLFAIHFSLNITGCEAFYMHDGSIQLSSKTFILNSAILFLGPAVIQLLQELKTPKTKRKIFLNQYLLALTSVGLITLAINKPCELINGGHYMFINFLATAISFLLKIICYILLAVTLVQTCLMFTKTRR